MVFGGGAVKFEFTCGNWPEILSSVEFGEGVTAFSDPAEMELRVRPCGGEAWEVLLVLWAAVVPIGYEPLEVVLEDCLDLTRFKDATVDPLDLQSPRDLVDDVARALARVLAVRVSSIIAELDLERGAVTFTVEAERADGYLHFHSRGSCPLNSYLDHVTP